VFFQLNIRLLKQFNNLTIYPTTDTQIPCFPFCNYIPFSHRKYKTSV